MAEHLAQLDLFHNQFTRNNITDLLALREFHIATLVARRVPYTKIAAEKGISVGRLKNIISEIYSKLAGVQLR